MNTFERGLGQERQNRSLEEQLERPDIIKINKSEIETVDVIPEHQKTEVPVLFAPAWACTMKVYKEAIRTLTKEERRVISLNHPRFGGSTDIPPEKAAEKYPTQELRKALTLLGILSEKGIKKTDVIAHSEGAINTVIAEALHPEKFRNIVLFAPAGLIGKDTFTRLLKGFAGQSKRAKSLDAAPATQENPIGQTEIPITEIEKEVAAAAAKEALLYLAKNPIRGIKEATNVAKSQIHEMLLYLREKGVRVVVMSGVDDPVFPMEKMQTIAKADMLEGFLSVRGGHGEIGGHPELHMKVAEQMLTAMEERQKKQPI